MFYARNSRIRFNNYLFEDERYPTLISGVDDEILSDGFSHAMWYVE